MTDLDRDLRKRLRTLDLPPAPVTLERALRDVVRVPVATRREPGRRLLLLGLAAVLLIGGAVGVGAALLSREPTITYTDTFSLTGSMTTPRIGAMAVLLRDGGVLMAGGSVGAGALSSAELYDPASGTFTPTGSMTTERSYATATLLKDGRVLIVAGADRQPGFFSLPSTAELYDPDSGTFTPTGSMTSAREGATATLLADGRVLFAGGASGNPSEPLSSAELYYPDSGTFTPTGSMARSREQAGAVLLEDGRVLVFGGHQAPGDSASAAAQTDTAELYDPRTGTFTPTGSMTTVRDGPTGVLLPGGRVLVIGGWVNPDISSGVPVGGAFNGLTVAELYDPATGTFSATGSMVSPHRGQVATLLRDGRVLVTGASEVPVLPELYDARSGTFTQTAAPVVYRWSPTVTLLQDGRVLLAGGSSATAAPFATLATAELFH